MMDGFKRPKRPAMDTVPKSADIAKSRTVNGTQTQSTNVAESQLPPVVQDTQPSPVAPSVAQGAPEPHPVKPERRHRRKLWTSLAVIGVLVALAVLALIWGNNQLTPVDSTSTEEHRFEVKDGDTFAEVTSALEQRGLIRNGMVFDLYARMRGQRNGLKVSTCSLKKSMTAGAILDKLSKGCHDFKSVTFYPGATIEKPLYKPADATLDQTMYVRYVMTHTGYSEAQVNAALAKQYSSPLFADKPAGASLEGYIFGETYYVNTDATAEQVLETVFAQMNAVVTRNDLVAKFKAKGLNLYQGITLASIVQRELNCEGKPEENGRKARCYKYEQGIAQVFLNRLKENMTLGSDVTFIYAADQMGVTPSPDLDSPYNTRIHAGLPPGPIATPGELALKAVAEPDGSDNLFFIAGDDGLIYFAKTNAEHERNVQKYCQELCNAL